MKDVILLIAAVVLLITNVTAYAMMGVDKQRAIKKQWRTPERTLLLACACFGALGGWLGMQVFRHKTKHPKFTITVPVLLVVQIALLGWLVWRFLL